MEEFVELGRELGCDQVMFGRLLNWGSYPIEDYLSRAVCNADHPLHAELLSILARPVFSDPVVSLGNLRELRQDEASQTGRTARVDGGWLPVELAASGGIGSVDSAVVGGDGSLVVEGWAIDPARSEAAPARSVAVFDLEGRLLAEATTGLRRDDVAEHFATRDLLECGWRAVVGDPTGIEPGAWVWAGVVDSGRGLVTEIGRARARE